MRTSGTSLNARRVSSSAFRQVWPCACVRDRRPPGRGASPARVVLAQPGPARHVRRAVDRRHPQAGRAALLPLERLLADFDLRASLHADPSQSLFELVGRRRRADDAITTSVRRMRKRGPRWHEGGTEEPGTSSSGTASRLGTGHSSNKRRFRLSIPYCRTRSRDHARSGVRQSEPRGLGRDVVSFRTTTWARLSRPAP